MVADGRLCGECGDGGGRSVSSQLLVVVVVLAVTVFGKKGGDSGSR